MAVDRNWIYSRRARSGTRCVLDSWNVLAFRPNDHGRSRYGASAWRSRNGDRSGRDEEEDVGARNCARCPRSSRMRRFRARACTAWAVHPICTVNRRGDPTYQVVRSMWEAMARPRPRLRRLVQRIRSASGGYDGPNPKDNRA